MKSWLQSFSRSELDETFDPTIGRFASLAYTDTSSVEFGTTDAGVGDVTIRSVCKSFNGASGEHAVLRDLNIDIPGGQFIAILGPSGCGKSTLLNVVAGITPCDQGQILVDGVSVVRPTSLCNVVFQQHSLFPWMSALANVSFGPEMQGHPEPVRLAEHLLGLMGLTQFKHSYPAALSGGMQQRVAIARALSTNPTILLMDEPFGALDAQTRTRMQEELLRVWSRYRKTVIFITHDIDEAIYLADRTIVLGTDAGNVQEDILIDLPRQRSPGIMQTSAFLAIREKVSLALHAAAGAHFASGELA